MLLIIGAMISAFWASYENDRNRRDDRNLQQDDKISDQQIITYNLARAVEVINENQKDHEKRDEIKWDKYDAEFMEVWKSVRRSGSNVDMSKYKQ